MTSPLNSICLAATPLTDASLGSLAGKAHALDAGEGGESEKKLRETFNQFVGEACFGQMLKAMRSSLGEPAYFHGGRAEEVFQGQLDQVIAERMTVAAGERFSEPMFELFNLQQR